MSSLNLDKYCAKILIVMIEKGKMRFNELHRALEATNIGLSKPTLSDHLKHLVEEGYVTKKVEGVQQVSYTVDYERIGQIEQVMKQQKKIAQFIQKDQRDFFELTEKDQVEFVLEALAVRKLYEIQARIACELEPGSFEKQFGVLFWDNPMLERHEAWMIKKCLQDGAYRRQVLKTIDEWLKPYVLRKEKLLEELNHGSWF